MASMLISCRAPCCPDSRSSAFQPVTSSNRIRLSGSSKLPNKFLGSGWVRIGEAEQQRVNRLGTKVYAAVTITDDVQEYTIPTWSEFEIGHSPVYWETENGFPPTSGERLTIFYNPVASKLVPDANYGIAFNGGFNQPIMCGGEPRLMTRKDRGRIASPFYAIKIIVPKHALTLIFSLTDGVNWDGPYKIQFEIPTKWRNKPISFFNEGLAEELSQEGACEKVIYPEANFALDRCVFPAGLVLEGGDRCKLDLVPGCTDPESPFFDPLANVDDGSCPTFSDEAGEN